MVVIARQRCQWEEAARQEFGSPRLVGPILERTEAEDMTGGTPDTQKEFLEILAFDAPKRPQDRHKRKPTVANEFALGYTYQDVLDADQEGEILWGVQG